MPSFLGLALGALFRWGLAALGGYLVERGIWTTDINNEFAIGMAAMLVSLVWSLWQKFHLARLLGLEPDPDDPPPKE